MSLQPPLYPVFLSVVVVLRNPGEADRDFVRRLVGELQGLVEDFEVILVDNGSDATPKPDYAGMIQADALPNILVFRLIQKVEPEAATWAGVENSLGDFVLVLTPTPAALPLLPAVLAETTRGRELVFLRNTARREPGPVAGVLRAGFERLFRWLGGVDLAMEAAPDRLMAKRVVSFLLQHPRPALRYRALPAAAGFAKSTLEFSAPVERRDESLFAKARRGARFLVGNTIAPVRLASSLALAGAGLNVLYSVYVVAVAFSKADVAPGWTTLSLQQSGMFFLLSLVVFVLAEYLVQVLRWNLEGPAYFLADELASSVVTRRQRLNIESPEASRTERP